MLVVDNETGKMTDDSQVETGVVVSSPGSTGAVADVLDLTGLINSYIDQIDNIKKQVNKFKEMLDDIYANDPTYQAHDKAVKEAVKVRGNTKKQIQKQPSVSDLTNQIQGFKNQSKELSTNLSDYLQEYAKSTGSTTFETTDGQVRQIVYTARLASAKPQ